jgi:hypothetical protein
VRSNRTQPADTFALLPEQLQLLMFAVALSNSATAPPEFTALLPVKLVKLMLTELLLPA